MITVYWLDLTTVKQEPQTVIHCIPKWTIILKSKTPPQIIRIKSQLKSELNDCNFPMQFLWAVLSEGAPLSVLTRLLAIHNSFALLSCFTVWEFNARNTIRCDVLIGWSQSGDWQPGLLYSIQQHFTHPTRSNWIKSKDKRNNNVKQITLLIEKLQSPSREPQLVQRPSSWCVTLVRRSSSS